MMLGRGASVQVPGFPSGGPNLTIKLSLCKRVTVIESHVHSHLASWSCDDVASRTAQVIESGGEIIAGAQCLHSFLLLQLTLARGSLSLRSSRPLRNALHAAHCLKPYLTAKPINGSLVALGFLPQAPGRDSAVQEGPAKVAAARSKASKGLGITFSRLSSLC